MPAKGEIKDWDSVPEFLKAYYKMRGLDAKIDPIPSKIQGLYELLSQFDAKNTGKYWQITFSIPADTDSNVDSKLNAVYLFYQREAEFLEEFFDVEDEKRLIKIIENYAPKLDGAEEAMEVAAKMDKEQMQDRGREVRPEDLMPGVEVRE